MSYVNTTNIKRLVTGVNMTLIALCAFFAVTLFYQFVGLRLKPAQAPSVTTELKSAGPSETSAQAITSYDPIVERDLFKIGKTAQAPATGPKVDLEALEKTKLNLKLWGTVSGNPEQAYAVIEDTQKHEQNLFRVGDTVQNATVKMVLREKVVLSVEGKDEILTMEDMEADSGSPMMASRGHASQAAEQPTSRAPGEQRIAIERGQIDDAFKDINKLMTDIAITPHMEDGQPKGLNLNRIQPDSVFRRMGLRNGDILLGVNGQPVLTVEDAMKMYESIRTSEEVQVQLQRRGQDRTINYNIR